MVFFPELYNFQKNIGPTKDSMGDGTVTNTGLFFRANTLGTQQFLGGPLFP
jgi:hypothetical protein